MFGAVTNGSSVISAIFSRHGLAEPVGRVEPGAHRRAAGREFVQARQRRFDALEVGVELRRVAAELLAQRQRDGVLQVGSADLDDVGELASTKVQFVAQRPDRRQQVAHDRGRRGDVHRGGERVVGGLRHVDVVVRMDR